MRKIKRISNKGISAVAVVIITAIVVGVVVGSVTYLVTRPGAPKPAPAKKVGTIYVLATPQGRGDLGFIDMSYKGAEMAADEFGFDVRGITFGDPAQMPSVLDMAAKKPDARLIVGTSFIFIDAIDKAAAKYPEDNFIIIDTPAAKPRPNVIGFLFDQHKISAIGGALNALLAIRYDKPHVGGVFGKPIPVLWDFEIGYKWGVQWAIDWYKEHYPDNYNAEPASSIVNTPRDERVLYDYIMTWSDTTKCEASAREMYGEGAISVYNVCGGAGLGIFSAVEKIAKEKGLDMGPPFAMGVDADQDWMTPGFIIASCTKRCDRAVCNAAKWVYKGKFQQIAKKENSSARLGIGTTFAGETIIGDELSDIEMLDVFIEFGKRAEAVTGKDILPATPEEIKAKVREMREAQPDWIWNAVKEFRNKIVTGEPIADLDGDGTPETIPDVWTKEKLDYWRGIFG